MKKMFMLVFVFALFLISMMGMTACGDDSEVTIDNSFINDIGGAGNFVAINMNTSDTVKMSGAVYIGKLPELNAKNGERIKLSFTPADKYKDIHFVTTYILHDSTEVKDAYEYEYILEDVAKGVYKIGLYAKYKDDKKDISAGGSLELHVDE